MSPFLKSPMPGTVVSVAVSVGETVWCVLTRPHIYSLSDKNPLPLPSLQFLSPLLLLPPRPHVRVSLYFCDSGVSCSQRQVETGICKIGHASFPLPSPHVRENLLLGPIKYGSHDTEAKGTSS